MNLQKKNKCQPTIAVIDWLRNEFKSKFIRGQCVLHTHTDGKIQTHKHTCVHISIFQSAFNLKSIHNKTCQDIPKTPLNNCVLNSIVWSISYFFFASWTRNIRMWNVRWRRRHAHASQLKFKCEIEKNVRVLLILSQLISRLGWMFGRFRLMDVGIEAKTVLHPRKGTKRSCFGQE